MGNDSENTNGRGGSLVLWDHRLRAINPGSCSGKTDGQRIHIGIEWPRSQDDRADGSAWPHPIIDVAYLQLPEISALALNAIELANDPPFVFNHGGGRVRLHIDQNTNQVVLQPLVGKVLRNLLARVADWFREGKPIAPPGNVVSDIEATADVFDLPALEAVVTCPVATPAGLVTRAGYAEGARIWYQPDPDLVVPPIPVTPSGADVQEALAFIENNLLVDFPFVDDCDRAVAWAALMLPFVRPLIDGPTPLHLITAPAMGTGKTLLAEALTVPALGMQDLGPMTVDCEESEMRKRITSFLRKSPTVILMDNLGQGRRLESSSLASVLTARGWRDRLLGSSVMASLPVRCLWLATGNNPILSDELVRRTLRCRLNAKTSRPHLRQDFKHPDLLHWAKANRAALIRAVLTLVQAWLAGGKNKGDVRLGMYESWSAVVGGVLNHAGIQGLRKAIELLQGEETDTEKVLAPFITAWWRKFQSTEVGVKDLYDIAVETGSLDAVMDVHLTERQRARGAQTERSQQTRLGKALRRLSDQVYVGFRIEAAGTDRCSRQMYRLVAVDDSSV